MARNPIVPLNGEGGIGSTELEIQVVDWAYGILID
jgi:hypothetical protein